MKFRQVHLDFHTSPLIDGIGEKFDKKQFQEALKIGHVNSITVFSKCHHGYAFHPSQANEMHPNLKFDLLKEQIDACHEIGVRVPVYLSAGLDEKIARIHPDWLVRNKDESTMWAKDFSEAGYHKFCMNTPYLDVLLSQIEEVCKNYDADEIFLDIVNVQPCYCQYCIKTLTDEGKDPYDEKNILELAEKTYANYARKVRESIDKYKPGLPVYHNGGHTRRGRRDIALMNSHFELESLPTGGWGYDHFPLSVSYARTLDREVVGMTGKFHTSWGEFGGFKHPNALRYEVALALANGAASSVGDQLHPSAEMNMATYELIGKAFKETEEKEPWVDGYKNKADIALLSQEAVENYFTENDFSTGVSGKTGNTDAGAVRLLLEGKYLFDVIDLEADFSKYKVIILPDTARVDSHIKDLIDKFIDNGGRILATGTSGLYRDEDSFAFDFGAEYVGVNEFNPDYFVPEFQMKAYPTKTPFVMYSQGHNIALDGGEVLATRENPYFNRTAMHFSSHKHTPNNMVSAGPAIVAGDDGIYISWSVFEEYATMGSYVLKEMVFHSLDLLLGEDKSVVTNLPAQGVVTLTQKDDKEIVHLLYASPVKRGNGIEIIEDLIPVINTAVSLKTDKDVKKVTLVPQGKEIQFVKENGAVNFNVKEFTCHQMICVE